MNSGGSLVELHFGRAGGDAERDFMARDARNKSPGRDFAAKLCHIGRSGSKSGIILADHLLNASEGGRKAVEA
jgi:hypothetical protein